MNTTTMDYAALAAEIVKRMPPPITRDIDLWGSAEVAAYLKASNRQVCERLVPLPGFPKKIVLPSIGTGRMHPRWKASEIIEWAEKHQEKKR